MAYKLSNWREIDEEISPIDSLNLRKIDTLLKVFWEKGKVGTKYFSKYSMHLAHGYSHAIYVANLSKKIVEDYKPKDVSKEIAFTTGFLHDAYRPIDGEGVEVHGAYCGEIAQAILEEAGTFQKNINSRIVNAIKAHDVSDERLRGSEKKHKEALDLFINDNLTAILFLADKSHMNIERVMSYAYDCDKLSKDPNTPEEKRIKLNWFKPSKNVPAMDVVLVKLAKKFSRDGEIALEIANAEKYGKYCSNLFDAWGNTIDEIQSQREKEKRKEDFCRTIMLFWGFKETISNFRYLVASEKKLYKRSGNILYSYIYKILSRYNSLLLHELEEEPFRDILRYKEFVEIMRKRNARL